LFSLSVNVQPVCKDDENYGVLADLLESRGKMSTFHHYYREITKRNYGNYERAGLQSTIKI
jgi:hypothetical protein